MFRKVVTRLTVGALLAASVLALGAATRGSAGVGFVTTSTFSSFDPSGVACPGFGVNERHYCLVVTTYNNLKPSGGVEVDLTLQNYDQSTLTNPSSTLTWDNTNANLTFVSSTGATCSSPSDGTVTCSYANIPGVGSASGPGVTPISATVKIYFTAAATVPSVTFSATATAKENGNDNTGANNVETQSVNNAVMTFDSNSGAGANEDATVVLPKTGFNKPHLFATLANSSVDFTSSSPPFIAQFAASNGAACSLGVSCSGLLVTTDLSGAAPGTFSAANQILWTADVASNNTNVLAVHTYDPVSITASAPKTLTTAGTSFANCDGVTFTTAPTGLSAGVEYFVRNVTTTPSSTSFQVATSAKGSTLSFTGSGSFSGSCIRIIGDDSGEKLKGCTTASPPAPPALPPGICAAKIDNSTVRVYLWDAANGKIGY